MSRAVSFRESLVAATSGLGRTKRTTTIAHVALIVMFAVCLGFPLMHGYDNLGLGLAIVPSVLLAAGIGVVCHAVFVPLLALADFCEARSLA